MIKNRPSYNEEKTTEAAALLLQLAGTGKKHKWLIKMLYLVDREALEKWERPITFDSYCSMEQGQVVSKTYNIIKGERGRYGDFWRKYINKDNYWYVHLIGEPPKLRKLSPADEKLIQQVFLKYGHMTEDELAKFTHGLPEYRDPGKSSLPTSIHDLLTAIGYNEADVERIIGELAQESVLESLLVS